MVKSKLIGPPEATFLEDEPKFWYRDKHGKATPVEMEYLLPRNQILIEETYTDEGVWGKKVDTQTYMNLPYFPGDIFYNDKAARSPAANHDLLFWTMSADRNGAWLRPAGSEDIAPRVRASHYGFHYEGKTYLIKTVQGGTDVVFTKDGKRGYGVNKYLRFYARAGDTSKTQLSSDIKRSPRPWVSAGDTSGMLTLSDLNPNDPATLRMMSCLGTLFTAEAVGSITGKLRRNKPNPFLMGAMDSYSLDLVGRKSWTAGPF